MLPYLLAAAALPALAKVGLGAYQLSQHVNPVDSTTAADREVLGNARQAQAGQAPGLVQLQGRLAQSQAATLQGAALGSGSGSDYLAAASAANQVRSGAEQQASVQAQQYHERANAQLNAALNAAANRARADADRAAQANAQLKSAGLNNLSNALTEGSSVAAYGLSGAGSGANSFSGASPATDYYGPYNPYRRGGQLYGGFPV